MFKPFRFTLFGISGLWIIDAVFVVCLVTLTHYLFYFITLLYLMFITWYSQQTIIEYLFCAKLCIWQQLYIFYLIITLQYSVFIAWGCLSSDVIVHSSMYKRIHLEDISLKVTAILIYCFSIKIISTKNIWYSIHLFPRLFGTEYQYLPLNLLKYWWTCEQSVFISLLHS